MYDKQGFRYEIAVLVLNNEISPDMFKNWKAAIATLAPEGTSLLQSNPVVIAGYGVGEFL